MRLARAIVAAAALLAVLAGLPYLLLHTVGNPLLAWPDLAAGDVNDRVVYSVLAAVAWLAWAQFLLAVLVELASGVRRTPVPRRIPGVFAFQQLSARGLVTAMLMLAPAVLAAVAPTAVAVAAASHSPAAVTAVVSTTAPHRTQMPGSDRAEPDQVAGRAVMVEVTAGGPHTWWDLAEHHLGSGQRWAELWHLNQGRPEPGGVRLTAPGVLKDGWTLLIPTPAQATNTDATADQDSDRAVVAATPLITEHLSDPHQRTVVVREGDSLARIATQHGTNWVQLWHANQNRPEPGGKLGDPNYLEPGWTIAIPAPPTTTTPGDITVHAGDTLSRIAADHHTTTAALWANNAGRAEPDGTFTDPDYLEPGWTLTLPDTATPADRHASTPDHRPAAAEHHTQPHGNSGGQAAAAKAAAERAAAERAAEQLQAAHDQAAEAARQEAANPADAERQQGAADAAKAAAEAEHTLASGSASAPTTAQASPTAANASATPSSLIQSHPDHRLGADEVSSGPMLMVAGGGAVLLAGVSLTVLLRHRRSQFRRRRPGRVIAEPPTGLHRVERTLVTVGGPAMSDVDRLDRALRGLSQRLSGTEDGRLPDVIAVRMTREDIELVLATPMLDSPDPWSVGDAGLRWTLHRTDPDGYDPAAREYHYAPYPALVSIGHTPDGDLWLIDLERIGSLGLSGPTERCLNLARFFAAELAHNTWSDLLQLTLVGFGTELTDLNPDRLTCTDDLDTAVADLHHQHTRTTDMMATAGVDVATGRLRNVAGDVWPPQILLLAPAVDQSDHLDEVLRAVADTDRSAVAVILTRTAPDHIEADDTDEEAGEIAGVRWRISIDDDGTLTIPALGVHVVAEQLPAAEAADLAQLMAVVATAEDRPAPAAPGIQSWEDERVEDEDAGAAEAPVSGPATPPPLVRLSATSQDRTNSLLPLSAATYVERAATTAADIETLAPAAAPTPEVRGVDRTLDDDVAAWNDPADPTPKVSLLGPITVRAPGQLNPQRPRKAFNTEVIAYLAARPRGATIEQFATDMWPDDPNPAAKPKARNAFYTARRCLGKNPTTGADYLPAKAPVPGTKYRLEGVLIDAELFRRLHTRAKARGAQGITDLQTALNLVTGPPFDQRRPGSYTWLTDTHLDHEYTAMIVDTAHLLATHYLTTNQPTLAAAAAHTAITAGSLEDTPLLDLAAASHAQGHHTEAHTYIKRIMTNHDADIEEDLPPRTYQILLQHNWIPRAS